MSAKIKTLSIEDRYQKKEQKEHVLDLPDTYIGSIDIQEEVMWVVSHNSPDADDLADVDDQVGDDVGDQVDDPVDDQVGDSDVGGQDAVGDMDSVKSNSQVGSRTMSRSKAELGKPGESLRMVQKQIRYVPGLYKIYDEILVNAIDHWTRMDEVIRKQKLMKEGKMPETSEVNCSMKLRPVKNLYVSIDQESGTVSVKNDGDGIPVVLHKEHKVYVPELIFSQFLTSGNYVNKKKKVGGGSGGGSSAGSGGSSGGGGDAAAAAAAEAARNFNQGKIIGGKNGFGAKLTAAYSTSFTIETVDANSGKFYQQTYSSNLDVIGKPVIKNSKVLPYTKISFTPDFARFGVSGITDDIYLLFEKRVYDAAGWCTGVSVHLNETKIPINTFYQYCEMFLGTRKVSQQKREYFRISDRWELCATYSDTNQFEQVSMVNGILTSKGGKHVDHVADKICNKLSKLISTQKLPIAAKVIKPNLRLFLRAVIEDPAFDSQTKECLTNKVLSFGSRFEISDEDVKKIGRCGITERSKDFSRFRDEQSNKSTDGKKTNKVYGMKKLTDAEYAGNKNPKLSEKCTLVLTEGDSAKGFALKGLKALTATDRKFWGFFPLKGKPLNVRDASTSQVDKNEELTCVKKILGLRGGADYSGEKIKDLRYGRVMILSDQDYDGDHIKGLVQNYFHKFWPSLISRNDFVATMITPIVKVWKERTVNREVQRQEKVFYSENEYKDWKKVRGAAGGWNARYYKGLGTSSDKESEEAFRTMKVIQYERDPEETAVVDTENGQLVNLTDQAMDLAFVKKNADLRKEWLQNADLDTTVDYDIERETYSDFINHRLIHFSYASTKRAIPSLCDGLKPSQRKIIYYMLKKSFKKAMKVSQLSGYISAETSYHHGEMSLQGAIVKLAQNYVGSHNLNYLVPEGNFGSKFAKGDDAASARYVFTKPEWILKHLYCKDDMPLYKYLDDDGFMIEPEWYLPVIPMVVVNGAEGIGTGYSTTIPQHNPLDVISRIKCYLEGQNLGADPVPWYRGFTGKIERNSDGSFTCFGEYRISGNKILVKELPIDIKFEDYKVFLENLEKPQTDDDSSGKKKKREPSDLELAVRSVSTDATLCQAEITFKPRELQRMLAQGIPHLEKELKLRSRINITNMVLFDRAGNIKRYSSVNQMIKEFCDVRLEFYSHRKEMLLEELDFDLIKARSRYRFVNEVMDKKIKIERKSKAEIWTILEKGGYPQLANKFVYNPDLVQLETINPEEGMEDVLAETKESYTYLLDMKIWSFSNEMLEKLRKLIDEKESEIQRVSALEEKEMWLTDLEMFEKEYLFWIKNWYKERKLNAPQFKKTSVKKTTKMKLLRKVDPDEDSSSAVGGEVITV